MARQARLRSISLDAAHTALQQQRNGTSRRGKPGRLLRAAHPSTENGPARVPCRDRLCRNYRLGALAAISLGLRHALRLGLRVADCLGQHFAQLSLSLRRHARDGFLLPLGHEQYLGMLEGKLNPVEPPGQMFHVRICVHNSGHPTGRERLPVCPIVGCSRTRVTG